MRLMSNSDYQRVRDKVLIAELNKCDEQNRTLDGVPLYRSQGRSTCIVDLLSLEKTATKVLTGK